MIAFLGILGLRIFVRFTGSINFPGSFSPFLWGFLDLEPEVFHVVFWEFPFLDVKPFKKFSQDLLGNLGPGVFLRVSCKHSYRSYCIY